MAIKSFPNKRSAETITITFDEFSMLGNGETISTAVFSAAYFGGTNDASPQNIITGSSTISGSKVMQRITAGVSGTYYCITATVTTSAGQILTPRGILLVLDEF